LSKLSGGSEKGHRDGEEFSKAKKIDFSGHVNLDVTPR
jgi:hypothetical protein